jgi:predicted RNase H-like HicB family nuclease
MTHKYSIQLLWSTEDGAYIASVPELPGCKADGSTPEEAVNALNVIISEWMETAKEEKREIPQPMSVEKHQEACLRFRQTVKEHIQREVEKAVRNVLRDIPAMSGPQDPSDFWKAC